VEIVKIVSKEASVESVLSRTREDFNDSKDELLSPTISSKETSRFKEVDKILKSPRAERIGFKGGKPFNTKANHFANRKKTASERTDEPLMYSGDGIQSPFSGDEQLQVDSKQVKLQPKTDKHKPLSPVPIVMKASGN
jgi:hypothetical protein